MTKALVALTGVFLAIISGAGFTLLREKAMSKPEAKAAPAEDVPRYDICILWAAYQQSIPAADAAYRGKKIEVVGEAVYSPPTKNEDGFIVFRTNGQRIGSAFEPKCYLGNFADGKIHMVKLTGVCKGIIRDGEVIITDTTDFQLYN